VHLPPRDGLHLRLETCCPLGQLLWLKELEDVQGVPPPLQAPEAYNLDGIIAEMKASITASHAGE